MKLPDAVEQRIEDAVDVDAAKTIHAPDGDHIDDAEEKYLRFVLRDAPSLKGLRVVVDCANGAAYKVAPEALRRAGADVEAIYARPDGRNINQGCGSTHPEALQKRVIEAHAHVGLAHDGDADRLIAVDERGDIVDGDQILAICALDRKRRGILTGDAVVTTVMANLGFHQAMARHGIHVIETNVGDRYVLEALLQKRLQVGGEQSGHVIFLDRHTTGDGIVTALQLLDVLMRADVPLSELAAVAPRLPQVLINVRVTDRDALDDAKTVWDEVEAVKHELGEHGRVLLRSSGTEPVVRVMVQADTQAAADAAAERLADAVRIALAG
jgi:phosphoglucosamine mutase